MKFEVLDGSQGNAEMPVWGPCCHFSKLEDALGGVMSFLAVRSTLALLWMVEGDWSENTCLSLIGGKALPGSNQDGGFCFLGGSHQCLECLLWSTLSLGHRVLLRVLRAHGVSLLESELCAVVGAAQRRAAKGGSWATGEAWI